MAKKVSKVVKKEKVVKPVAVSETRVEVAPPEIADHYLTREEQLALEEATNATEKAKLSAQLAEQVVKNKQLERSLFDRVVRDSETIQLQKEAEYKQRAKMAGELVNSLKRRYGIAGDFQYDPTSGRIVK